MLSALRELLLANTRLSSAQGCNEVLWVIEMVANDSLDFPAHIGDMLMPYSQVDWLNIDCLGRGVRLWRLLCPVWPVTTVCIITDRRTHGPVVAEPSTVKAPLLATACDPTGQRIRLTSP